MNVEIATLGAQGDGLAETDEGRFYVPYTVPGDLVEVRRGSKKGDGYEANLVSVMRPSPHRQEAICAHFGTCGGCALQHVDQSQYMAFKRERVAEALARRGLADVPVREPVVLPAGTRRRTRWTVKRGGRNIRLGYAERGTHRLVDIRECPVLDPRLQALLAPLRSLGTSLMQSGEALQISATLVENGIDVLFAADRPPTLEIREGLAVFAQDLDLARVTWEAEGFREPIAERRAPIVELGALKVVPAPGTFLQATLESETFMMNYAEDALKGADAVADLFAGCGTFTGALVKHHSVSAFESDSTMVAAIDAAIRRSQSIKPARALVRDLFRDPLTAVELKSFEGIVIDPPRAGAKAQTEALAQSELRTIVAFSCNPSTFARDARILVDGGYSLKEVVPIDQFRWSAHVELAATFYRA